MSRKASSFPRVRFDNAGARYMRKSKSRKPCKVRNRPTDRGSKRNRKETKETENQKRKKEEL